MRWPPAAGGHFRRGWSTAAWTRCAPAGARVPPALPRSAFTPCVLGLRRLPRGARATLPALRAVLTRVCARPCWQDLLVATSESGSLAVLQIDAARRRMRCIEQVRLPDATVFPGLWAGQTHAHLEPRQAYGRYLRVDPSGAAVATSSLDGKVAILPVQHDGVPDRLFSVADSAELLPSRPPALPTAKVVECAYEHVTGIVADLAFVQLGTQSPRMDEAPMSPAALLYLAVLVLVEDQVTQKCDACYVESPQTRPRAKDCSRRKTYTHS